MYPSNCAVYSLYPNARASEYMYLTVCTFVPGPQKVPLVPVPQTAPSLWVCSTFSTFLCLWLRVYLCHLMVSQCSTVCTFLCLWLRVYLPHGVTVPHGVYLFVPVTQSVGTYLMVSQCHTVCVPFLSVPWSVPEVFPNKRLEFSSARTYYVHAGGCIECINKYILPSQAPRKP